MGFFFSCFLFLCEVGQLQDSAGAGGKEGPQGTSHSRPGERGPDPGKTTTHRDLPGHHVLYQQRGQAGLLHDSWQDWLLNSTGNDKFAKHAADTKGFAYHSHVLAAAVCMVFFFFWLKIYQTPEPSGKYANYTSRGWNQTFLPTQVLVPLLYAPCSKTQFKNVQCDLVLRTLFSFPWDITWRPICTA